MLKRIIFSCVLIGLYFGMPVASADNNGAPTGNAHLTASQLNHVTEGDALLLEQNNQLVISAINETTQPPSMTLQTTDKSKTVSVSMFPADFKISDVKVGQTVQLSTSTIGTILSINKQTIAFIPNETAKNLFYSFPRN